MIAGSLVLGITTLCFALWLHWNDTQGWPDEQASFKGELASQYLAGRKRSRRRIHIIIAACGALMLIAALAGAGPVWIAAWMSVIAALMTVIVLAGFDAFRTHRYQNTKPRDVRRKLQGDDD